LGRKPLWSATPWCRSSLPSGVRSAGEGVFDGCKELTRASFRGKSSLAEIG
jgi:hypothetical protein